MQSASVDRGLASDTRLFGPDNRLTNAARNAITKLWLAARSVINLVATPLAAPARDDLVRLLDRATIEPPFWIPRGRPRDAN
ncbi:hypothetical protein AB0K15_41030 [Amycolatopsis sp. NPDC049253]|uniref:hypothetical protein n=1 Tax=Amycolatopsis sp. NPDC049253 TaxID=3155274 RepID=UPI00344318E3